LLQQSAEFISTQWLQRGRVDTDSLRQMADAAFSGQTSSLSQEVVDLFHLAESYTRATTQQVSQARLTVAAVRASWQMMQQVQRFDLRTYAVDIADSDLPIPFSWERDPYEVAKDLTRIALSIAKTSEMDIDDLDAATSWMQNALNRAATLVKAEYRMLTHRALDSRFKEPLFSEVRMAQLHDLYPDVIDRIHSRARDSFMRIERDAVDMMSATAWKHYLPKTPPAGPDSPHISRQEHEDANQQPPSVTARPFRFSRPAA